MRFHRTWWRTAKAGFSICLWCVFLWSQSSVATPQGFVPFSGQPINYLRNNLSDPVTQLQKRITRGEARLDYQPTGGYLKSLLNQLRIPISSQTLVFSKTSFQSQHISAKTPRAIYFNDDVYVGWVPGGQVLEVASFDPSQGAIFYVLDTEPTRHPQLRRAAIECTSCHVAALTRGVPGVLRRSDDGTQSRSQVAAAESLILGHETPIIDRWGGWYVTGTVRGQRHRGNLVQENGYEQWIPGDLLDLRKLFDTTRYLSRNSDVVAHLVLDHQIQMHNLITLTNYETRFALHASGIREPSDEHSGNSTSLPAAIRGRYEAAAEELLRYLLFANEAPLESQITPDSSFAREFVARGPRDGRGRSLRDLSLRTRIFEYPCSYLIYSDSFDALPNPVRSYIHGRLYDVLTGIDRSADFVRLSATDRQAIFEILVATKPEIAQVWASFKERSR